MARKHRNARLKTKHVPIEELVAPTPEQIGKGYSGDWIIDDEGRKAWAHRNTGHDPIARWERDGKIDQRQKAAIDVVRRLWDLVGIHQRVTANYDERMGASVSAELCSLTVLEAKEDLARIEGYFSGVRPYWNVFENVARFGMSAGVAGSEEGFTDRAAQVKALLVVRFIADMVATWERI